MRTELHWQRSIRCYVDHARTVGDAFRATVAAAPDSPALSDGDASHSYAALDVIVDGFAGSLARLGVRQGDRVAVYLGNCMEAIISVLGIARLGAVLVPVGSRLRAPQKPRRRRPSCRPATASRTQIASARWFPAAASR
jgi:long-chain acyl-CoA synthetase